MHEHPSLSELVSAVKSFIDDSAVPALAGHAAFHARVASNVLAIVQRELALGPAATEGERTRLLALLKADPGSPAGDLNLALCAAIRDGILDARSPGLLEHLKTTAFDQLKIDQPLYSGAFRFDEAT